MCKHVDFLESKWHFNLSACECGFYVHPNKRCIEASPDGVVHDLIATDARGTLEIKCPYTVRNCTIAEVCKDTTFYCF